VRRTVPSGENSWRRLCPARNAPPDDDDDDDELHWKAKIRLLEHSAAISATAELLIPASEKCD